MKPKDVTADKLWERVAWWQQEMAVLGIAQWRCEGLFVDEDTDSLASVLPSGYYDRFKIWFTPEFLADADERELDEIIVHELMHIVMRDLDRETDRAEKWVPGGGQESSSDWRHGVKAAREALVHRVATYIVAQHYAEA